MATWITTISQNGTFSATSVDVADRTFDWGPENLPSQVGLDHVLVEAIELHLDTVVNVAVRRPRVRLRSAGVVHQTVVSSATQGTGDSVDYHFGTHASVPAYLSQVAAVQMPPLRLIVSGSLFLRVDADASVAGDVYSRVVIRGHLVPIQYPPIW